MDELYDVAIIGGGPAGSTAATVLARAGRRVLLLERERFPRFHIGESLLPYSQPVFERLGIVDLLDRTFLPKYGAELATSCGTSCVRFQFRNGFRLAHTQSYQVDRATFDHLLLKQAREAGAEVREETKVAAVEFASEDVQLRLESPTGPAELRARLVIDASGRQSVLGGTLRLKERYPGLDKFSVYAHWEGVTREAGREGTLTRMVRGADRWFWMIPLGETRMSIGMVMDTAAYKALRQSPEEALEAALADQPVIAARMEAAERVTPVYSTGDYSYRHTSFAGDRWLLAGDAAGFIDPVFSTGVFLALTSGEQAAQAIDAALRKPAVRAREFVRYEKKLQRVMNLYLRFVHSWYTQEFIEVLSSPTQRFDLAGAINAVLAGNITGSLSIWWRMQIFYLVVFLQRFFPLCPRLSLVRGSEPEAAAAVPAICAQ